MPHLCGQLGFLFALATQGSFAPPDTDALAHFGQHQPTSATQPMSDDAAFGHMLSVVQGVSDVEHIPSVENGLQIYRFNLEQPVFHGEKGGETFKQRLTLIYRSSLAPTVIGTLGYEIVDDFGFSALAAGLGANELLIEHRYYGESVPDSNNYDALRIREAAADVHRAIQRLRPLMLGSWISAGASKGAMLALQHRRLYPFDTQATVAFAPTTAFGQPDRAYRSFLDRVGTADCRKKILDYQERMLENKEALLAEIEKSGIFEGLSYELMPGGLSEVFERSVHELEFTSWQLFGDELMAFDCALVPRPDEGLDTMIWYPPFDVTFQLNTDDHIQHFKSHYVQKAVELGSPGYIRPELASKFSVDVENLTPYLMGEDLPDFDPVPMIENYFWTSVAMNRVIMIHGDLDPYSTRAIELADPRIGEAYLFNVPNGTHLVGLEHLPESSWQTMLNALERWTGASWNPMSTELESAHSFGALRRDTAALLRKWRD